MPGILYLLPASLGESSWETTHPTEVRRIACDLDCFYVENAKTARAELKRLGFARPLQQVSMIEIPGEENADWAGLLRPVSQGKNAALMSEAGCPAIADPGAYLVRSAHELDIRVVPLVGPSSILLALMASGMNGQSFAFHGYLPVREGERRERVLALEKESRTYGRTQIFIETPYRNNQMFSTLIAACQPTTLLCTAVALTTTAEQVTTRKVSDWRRLGRPDLEKKPALFLMLAG